MLFTSKNNVQLFKSLNLERVIIVWDILHIIYIKSCFESIIHYESFNEGLWTSFSFGGVKIYLRCLWPWTFPVLAGFKDDQ